MKINDFILQPKIGDIVEFETDPDTVVEGLIVGETADGYIYEFSTSGYKELVEACTYGKYYCSTDRKWKCRQGPKQSRSVAESADIVNSKDIVSMDIPFLLRLMEYARENARSDLDLHFAAERIIELAQQSRPLTMDDYEDIFSTDGMSEAEYQGREVPLGKPMRGDVKKFKVYVRDPDTDNVIKVNFGHGGSTARRLGQKTMRIRKSDPARRRSFRARHRCHTAKDRTTARYWSCRAW